MTKAELDAAVAFLREHDDFRAWWEALCPNSAAIKAVGLSESHSEHDPEAEEIWIL